MPLLFLICINDLPSILSSSVCLFADDCLVYSKIVIITDSLELRDYINKLTEWCQSWQMSLNINKCKCMRFCCSRSYSPPSYFINSVPLDLTEQYKYLGVTLTSNLSWSLHIHNIVAAANRNLGYIRRNFTAFPPNLKLLLYITHST